jgi:hypothetical protein
MMMRWISSGRDFKGIVGGLIEEEPISFGEDEFDKGLWIKCTSGYMALAEKVEESIH